MEAAPWTKANKTLKGDALTAALEQQTWDPSIKSLVNFPQVLAMMSEKLDMTQRLGDAFLAQQKDVLDAVQRLRSKAQAQGTLKDHQRAKGDRRATSGANHRDQDRTDQSPGGVRANIQPDRGVWRMALSCLSTLCVLSARLRGSNRGLFLYRWGCAGRCLGIRLGGMQLARRGCRHQYQPQHQF